MKTLVVGLGNPILTDDGVGVKVAYAVEHALQSGAQGEPAADEITVTEACVGGLRLMELMVGYGRAIIVDAWTGQADTAAGDILRLTLDDLRRLSPTQHTASAHDTTLATALDAGRAMGMPLPDEVIIYAVTVENVLDFGEEMTPAVAAAVPRLVTAVMAELGQPAAVLTSP